MEKGGEPNDQLKGMLFAVIATLLWAGNYIIARGLSQQIAPIALAFCRWTLATLFLAPFAWNSMKGSWPLLKKHRWWLIASALCGVALFNTFIYIAGKQVTAINLALIGTTAAPVFVFLITVIFLKERLSLFQWAGAALCIAGILFLFSNGFANLGSIRFSQGDLWMLGAAFFFAVYTILVRRKPAALPAKTYLLSIFTLGALFLFPAFLIEVQYKGLPSFSGHIVWAMIYLGLCASVLAFLFWNISIARIGPAKTALFGNLIPVFAAFEAGLILDEKVNWVTMVSFGFIFMGLLLANWPRRRNT